MGTVDRIRWRLHLDTSKHWNAEAILRRLWKLLGAVGEAVTIDTYWKDPNKSVASFHTRLPDLDCEAATYQLLSMASRIAHGMQTSGPQHFANGGFEMAVFASAGFADSGVSFMEAAIDNHMER